MPDHVSDSHDVKFFQAACPLLVCVNQATNAATTKAIAVIMIPIGFAFTAVLSPFCAVVSATVAVVFALLANVNNFVFLIQLTKPPASETFPKNSLVAFPAFHSPLPAADTLPVIFPALAKKPPTAVVAGPITGARPIKSRVTLAKPESLDCAQFNVLFVQSSKVLETPLLDAIALFDSDSQLPPTCSILAPTFFCISLACSSKTFEATF